MKLIRFEAVWCPSCLIMKQRFKKLNLDNIEEVVYNYDVDVEPRETYQIGTLLPVVIVEKEGKEVFRFTGEKSVKELEEIIEKYKEL